jgi:hypothetical protein
MKEKHDFGWQLCDVATIFLRGCGGGVTSGPGTFETCRWTQKMSAYRGGPEVVGAWPK